MMGATHELVYMFIKSRSSMPEDRLVDSLLEAFGLAFGKNPRACALDVIRATRGAIKEMNDE